MVDLLEVVVRQEVSEVPFLALFLPDVGESFKDSQSRLLLGVWNVEFPKFVLDPPKLVGDLFFKLEPGFGRCFSQLVLVLGPTLGDL